ncbi:hypothetical protein [Streptodolium elevatio]|uniref:Uncharacterized protein n=1 Tax=Streptodolium elevatio TaxID=3157996 RepID=A0ABV3DUZ9_9ACTN
MAGLRFLPWVRDGVVRALADEDPLSGALSRQRGEVRLTVEVAASGADPETISVGTDAAVHGPGDVTALDPRQVIRCFPEPNAQGVDVSLFAAVDFDAPELPWQFTPARPDAQGRLRPWLVLVVVPENAPGVEFRTPAGALPRLTAPVAELPDLDESWAWAHAQLLLEHDAEDPADVIAGHPERTLSRLVCPRRLEPGVGYLAAVVPAFDAGCRAGLGQPPLEGRVLRPAWGTPSSPDAFGDSGSGSGAESESGSESESASGTGSGSGSESESQSGSESGSESVTLPVLHHWRFATGVGGDFESLVRRLRGRPLPESVGLRRVDLNTAGSGLPVGEPGVDGVSVLGFEGAVASPAMRRTEWAADPQASWQAVMETLLSNHDAWLTPPVYGIGHAQEVRLPEAGAPPQWLRELNLDPRYRAAAALGTAVVQRHQEDLAAAAWQRAAELVDINAQLMQGQLARDAAAELYGKRIDPARPGRAFSDGELLALTRPVHEDGSTADADLNGNAGVAATTSSSLRRLTRPRGPLARRLDAPPTADPAAWLAEGRSAIPAAALPDGGMGFGDVSREPLDNYGPDRLGNPSAAWSSVAATTARPEKELGNAGPAAEPDGAGAAPESDTAQPEIGPHPSTPPNALAGVAADEPMTAVGSSGGDLLDNDRFFLRSQDGRLFERRRLAGTWTWRDHGRPNATSPVITSATAVPPDRVYVRTGNNLLWERSWDGDRWRWVGCGAPPGGLASRPVAAGGSVFVLGGDGGLHVFETATRIWRALGKPGELAPYEKLFATPRPIDATSIRVATSQNRLFVCSRPDPYGAPVWFPANSTQVLTGSPSAVHRLNRFFYLTPGGNLGRQAGDAWVDHGRPLPDHRVVSVGMDSVEVFQDGSPGVNVLVSTPTGQLEVASLGEWDEDLPDGRSRVRWSWSQTRWQHPAGLAPRRIGPVIGDSHTGEETFMVTADGRLTCRVGTDWQDHGVPLDPRGSGPMESAAVTRPELLPGTGLFSSFLTAHLLGQSNPDRSRLWIGSAHDPDLEGRPDSLSPPREALALDFRARALGVAVGHVTGGLRPDLVVLTIRQPTAGAPCVAEYRIGRALDEEGVPTGGWLGPFRLPDPLHPNARGADLTLADLDGDGRLELVLAYGVSGPDRDRNRVYYRIGWGLDADGQAARGWTDSVPTPWTFSAIDGVGVDVVAMGAEQTPHLVVLADGQDGAARVCRYGVGRGVNRRGQVVGGWHGPFTVADGSAGPSAATGMAVTDLTGTSAPDLVVYRITGSAAAGHTGTFRIGFDLDAGTGVARWSDPYEPHRIPPGAEVSGAGLAVAELRAALAELRAKTAANFAAAAAPHQAHLLSVFGSSQDDSQDEVQLGSAAERIRARLDPQQTIPARVLESIEVGGRPLAGALALGAVSRPSATGGASTAGSASTASTASTPGEAIRASGAGAPSRDSGDSLRRLLAGLTFDVPAYELLRGLAQEHVAPGLPAVAPETMTALAANARFIEAFMVGLNHETSRELLWREFPADPRQTWFRQFWDVRNARSADRPLTDLPPFSDDVWRSGSLGSHLTSVGAPGEDALILVVRGEVLRRYPSTVVTMRQAVWTSETGRDPVGQDLPPIFSGWLSPDLLLFGFPLTAAVARGATSRTAGDAGRFFVLREQPTAPRFGLDLPPEDWTSEPFEGTHWDQLHWGHLPDGARFLSPYAPGLGRNPDGSPAGRRLDGAEYGRNAADMARVALQRPVLIARHASDVLPAMEATR